MGTATLFRPTTSATTVGGWVSKAPCVNELFPARAARLTDIVDVPIHDRLPPVRQTALNERAVLLALGRLRHVRDGVMLSGCAFAWRGASGRGGLDRHACLAAGLTWCVS